MKTSTWYKSSIEFYLTFFTKVKLLLFDITIQMKKLVKYIPNIKIKYVLRVIIVIFIVLIFSLKRQKEWMFTIGNNIIFMDNIDKQVELSTEDILKYEAEIQKIDDQFKNFVPWTWYEIDLGNGMKGMVDDSSPSQSWFIDKAKAYVSMWENNKAIKTLYKAFKYYPNSSTIIEEIVNIYIWAEKYEYAITKIKDLIETNPDSKKDYTKSLIQLYINKKEAETAGQIYIDYVKMGGEKDMTLMNQIRDLKWLGELQEFKQPTFK